MLFGVVLLSGLGRVLSAAQNIMGISDWDTVILAGRNQNSLDFSVLFR
jgi:hypothetical protein